MSTPLAHLEDVRRPAVPLATEISWIVAMVFVVLALPPVIYGYLSYRQFDFFKPSYFWPYEELWGAWRTGSPIAIFQAPLFTMNMTSGQLLSNMYSLTVGQLLLSVGLGVVMGLTLAAQLSLRKVCAVGSVGGSAAAAGSGLFSTLAASSTGILGCCGSSLTGGVLALAGLSATTASQIAVISPALQVAMIGLFLLILGRTRRRLRALVGQAGPSAT